MMTPKQYRIWRMLVLHRGKWLYIGDIAKNQNMSLSQLVHILCILEPFVKLERNEYNAICRACFDGTDEDIKMVERIALHSLYGIDDARRQDIHDILPEGEWVTSKDMVRKTSLTPQQISRVLSTFNDIEYMLIDNIRLFKRVAT